MLLLLITLSENRELQIINFLYLNFVLCLTQIFDLVVGTGSCYCFTDGRNMRQRMQCERDLVTL
jgi:hypothetical protein